MKIEEVVFLAWLHPENNKKMVSQGFSGCIESRAFFSGQKSTDEVAKLIQNKATTFLNA